MHMLMIYVELLHGFESPIEKLTEVFGVGDTMKTIKKV